MSIQDSCDLATLSRVVFCLVSGPGSRFELRGRLQPRHNGFYIFICLVSQVKALCFVYQQRE